MVSSRERTIEIDAPVAQVYEALGDPAGYARFLHGIAAVRPLGEGSLEFEAEGPGGARWPAVVTEMVPDASVAWTSRGTPVHSGVLALEQSEAERTRVTLRIDYDAGCGIAGDPTSDLARLAEMVRLRPAVPGARRLLSVAAILDRPVTDALGEPIAVVRDVHLDLDDHVVTSIAASSGAFDAVHLIPVPRLPLEEAARGISLPYTADMVRSAPQVEPGIEPDAPSLERAVRHFADPDTAGPAPSPLAGRVAPAPTPELQALADASDEGTRPAG